MRALAIITATILLALGANAAPSFDCAKAQSAVEKRICAAPLLQWLDRQVARLYNLASKQSGADRQALLAEQRSFIARREACGARYQYECLVGVHEWRLAELAPRLGDHEAYAKYRNDEREAELWIVRYGFVAAVSATGHNGALCDFEADNAQVSGKGVVRWRGDGNDACRIDIVLHGDNMRVETKSCHRHCGARASMDGLYTRIR